MWIFSEMVNRDLEPVENRIYRQPVSINLPTTGEAIPSDLGDIAALYQVIQDAKSGLF